MFTMNRTTISVEKTNPPRAPPIMAPMFILHLLISVSTLSLQLSAISEQFSHKL